MKHFLLAITIYFLSILSLFSQSYIEGIIKDFESEQVLPYATTLLKNNLDSTLVQGTISDENGKFLLNDIVQGKYILQINFIGYLTYNDSIEISKNNKIKGLIIKLKKDVTQLKEIEIIGDRGGIKQLVNKTVITPDSSDIKSSANAVDIMKKIPGVTVDELSNKISLLGEKRVLILINNVAREGRLGLETVKPEDIDRIEIINNPSSKYDAEYTAVINIILKDVKKSGFSAFSSLGVFNNFETASLDLEYGTKKLRFFSSYYFENRIVKFNIKEKRELTLDSTYFKYNSESNYNPFRKTNNSFKYGIDYFINKNNILNFTAKYEIYNYLEKGNSTFSNNIDNVLQNEYLKESKFTGKELLQNYSLYYNKTFNDNPDKNLLIDVNYYILNSIDDFTSSNSTTLNNVEYTLSENETNKKKSINTKIDYSQPISEKLSFDLGYNFYTRNFNNLFYTGNLKTNFLYLEYRNAAYIDGYFDINKLSFSGGVRFENSSIIINDSINNSISKVLPSFGTIFKINNQNSIRFNYDKSIVRPDIWELNPFISYSDSLNTSQGNPFLKPAIDDNFELSHTFRKNSFFISSTIYYDYTKDLIDVVNYINSNNVNNEIYNNITENNAYGFKCNFSKTFYKIWKITTFFNVYYDKYNYLNNINEGVSSNVNFSSNVDLPKNFSFGFYGFSISGNQYSPQGYSNREPRINQIYFGKKFNKNKGKLFLVAFNPIFKDVSYNYIKSVNYNIENKRTINSAMIGFFVTYNISQGKKIEALDREYNMEKDNKKN